MHFLFLYGPQPVNFIWSSFRHLLHNCFQAVLDHGQRVTKILANAYSQHCCVTDSGDSSSREKAIQLGFSLGIHSAYQFWVRLTNPFCLAVSLELVSMGVSTLEVTINYYYSFIFLCLSRFFVLQKLFCLINVGICKLYIVITSLGMFLKQGCYSS